MKLHCLFLLAATISAQGATAADFEQTVASILTRNCADCHSAKTKTSGYSVASQTSVIAGGNKHGRAVLPGDPVRSPLVRFLKGELQPGMPLGKTLAKADLEQIESWIRSLPPEDAPKLSDWRWPFEQPVKRDLPRVRNADWIRNPIDAFILAKLEEKGVAPAAAASKRTLARRLYLDLVGMPPTPQEMMQFIDDESPHAYEGLINRLLADRRYGERWGRHWLDLARYGETTGLEGDGAIGNAWRYRDWVIDAFNANMPYDRFVILQLAGGDEHSQTKNNYEPDVQGLIPTGFLRVAPWDRSNLVAAEVRQNYLSEITSTAASVFLGLTVGCARCHDHKYDPIPTRDFYRFQAFFNAVQAGAPVDVPYRDKALAAKSKEQIEAYAKRLEDGPEKRELDAFEAQLLRKLIAAKAERAKGKAFEIADLRLELKLKPQRLFTEQEQQQHADRLAAAQRTGDPPEKKALDAYEQTLLKKLIGGYSSGSIDPSGRFEALGVGDVRAEVQEKYASNSIFTLEEKNRHTELSGSLEIFERRRNRWSSKALVATNIPGPPTGPSLAPTQVLIRGDYLHPGETVEPGFPTAITGEAKPATLETDRYRQFPTRGHRLTLAKWIASPENPLTARVMVNRIWQHHFGQGIVRTPSDFGKNGERPVHPELLNWLAVHFVESGWDIKAMHRLMLLSNTYRQSADNASDPEGLKDPDNRLFSHFERRRQEAEAIRDSILFVSGRLNPEMGGPSVFPALPEDLADFARYGRTGGVMWEPNEKEEDARRRSVYIFQRRSLPLPLMASFDATPFSESCERRSSTTTPLQALGMMNGTLVQEEAEHLAARIRKEVGEERSFQIQKAFEIVLGRSPAPGELRKFSTFDGPLASLCLVLLNSNEFLYLE
jgi:mono/diheme cytochrome c family protein